MTEVMPQTRQRHLWWVIVCLFAPILFVTSDVVWWVLDSGLRSGSVAAEMSSALPQDEFERRIRDYLLAHPEVIGEAVNRLEARQRDQAAAEGQAVLKSRAAEVFNDPNSPTSGNPQGDVTVVEFFDYNCPYCRCMTPVMIQAERDDPKLRVVYKEFPILGAGSLFAAKATLAAARQGKYVAFHRALYQVRGPVDENKVLETAKTVGLDVDRLKIDMNDPKISALIEKNNELARALKIEGTPGFAIGDKLFSGATDLRSLQAAIASARRSPSAAGR